MVSDSRRAIKALEILVVLSLVVVAIASVCKLQRVIAADRELSRAEGACIAKLISEGVERKNIVASNGTCKIQ